MGRLGSRLLLGDECQRDGVHTLDRVEGEGGVLEDRSRRLVAGSTPLRRLGTPEDVAGAVLMFASPWSGFVTGQYITCDGGLVMA